MEKISGIYCIENIISRKKYVGKSKNILNRWQTHRSNLNKNKGDSIALQDAWNKYGENNFYFYILERCSEAELSRKEQCWIDVLCSRCEQHGYNLTDGGDGGQNPTNESRKRMSESHKGQVAYNKGQHHTEETRKKISEAKKGCVGNRKGCKQSPEAIEKARQAHLGRKDSEETKKKKSDAAKKRGFKMTPEHREKLRQSRLGSKHSEESKEKMRKASMGRVPANKGTHLTEEQRRKSGEANKGKKQSPETIAKRMKTMSENRLKKKELESQQQQIPMEENLDNEKI